MILGDLIERNASQFPHKPGYVFADKKLTHLEYSLRCNRLANALTVNLKRQSRVAILAQNRLEYIETFGAGELTGVIIVNLNWRLATPELQRIFEDCEPEVLIFEDRFLEQVAELRARSGSIRYIAIGDNPDWAERYEDVLKGSSDARPTMRAQPTDTAYLIYTSGTTGKPKGVMIGHEGFLSAIQATAFDSRAARDDRMLIVMPLFHVGGKIEQMVWSFAGATIYLHRTFDPGAILASIERDQITCAHLAPAMVHALLDAPEINHVSLGSLREIFYASAPMDVALMRRAIAKMGRIFTQHFGMTECPQGSSLHAHEHILDGSEEATKRLYSAGHAIMNTEIRIVHEDGTDCATGEIGEILIRCAGVMQGYWNNHSLSKSVIRDGWYYTADLGYFDAEKFLFVADRKKDMVISGGENIYPREVEEALLLHPAVLHCAVIGVPDEKWGEAVKACIVLRAGEAVTSDDLIEHCRGLIASYKKPKSVDIVDALPRLFNGKIDKKKLREPYWQGRARQVA